MEEAINLGQKLRILKNTISVDWCVDQFAGEVFIVDNIRVLDGVNHAVHNNYVIPSGAVEFIENFMPQVDRELYFISHASTDFSNMNQTHLLYEDLEEAKAMERSLNLMWTDATWKVKRWKIIEEDV